MEEWNPTSKDSSQLFETGMEIQKNSYMRFSVGKVYHFGIFFHLKCCTAVEEVLIIQKNFAKFFGPSMFVRS